jgi:hypothetical protein
MTIDRSLQVTSLVLPALTPREIVRRSNAAVVRLMPTSDIMWGEIGEGFVPIIATPEEFLHVHPEWPEEWLGIAPDGLQFLRWIDLVHPADAAESAKTAAALDSGELEQIGAWPNRYRRSDGTYQQLLWRAYVDEGTGLIYCGARPPRPTEMERVDRILRGRDRCYRCMNG